MPVSGPLFSTAKKRILKQGNIYPLPQLNADELALYSTHYEIEIIGLSIESEHATDFTELKKGCTVEKNV